MSEEEHIKKYLPLVRYIVNGFKLKLPKYFDTDDLYSVGTIALMAAVRKFDPSQERTFTGYAAMRIRGAIKDELRRIDVCSRRGRLRQKQIKKAIEEFKEKNNREPVDSELQKYFGVKPFVFKQWLEISKPLAFTSINEEKITENGSFSLEGVIADENSITSIDKLEKEQLIEFIKQKIEELPEKKKKMLTMYFFDEKTSKEIGKIFNLNRTRITQINNDTLAALKRKIEK